MRVIICFEKRPSVRNVSHLDQMRAMQRALRRAGLPLRYSNGFNPHPILAFASALSVGTASMGEIMDVGLTEELSPQDCLEALGGALPTGYRAVDALALPDDAPGLMGLTEAADYVAILERPAADLGQRVADLLAQPSALVEKQGKMGHKKGVRQLDIRPLIQNLRAQGEDTLLMRLALSGAGSAHPAQVAQCLGMPLKTITRTAILARDGEALLPMMDMLRARQARHEQKFDIFH